MKKPTIASLTEALQKVNEQFKELLQNIRYRAYEESLQ